MPVCSYLLIEFMMYALAMPNVPYFRQRLVKSRSSFFVKDSLKPLAFVKVAFVQKIMPVVQ